LRKRKRLRKRIIEIIGERKKRQSEKKTWTKRDKDIKKKRERWTERKSNSVKEIDREKQKNRIGKERVI
jgi:hypothetical protein